MSVSTPEALLWQICLDFLRILAQPDYSVLIQQSPFPPTWTLSMPFLFRFHTALPKWLGLEETNGDLLCLRVPLLQLSFPGISQISRVLPLGISPSSLLFFLLLWKHEFCVCMATAPFPTYRDLRGTPGVSDWKQRTKCRIYPLITHPTTIWTPGEKALLIHIGIPLIHLVGRHKPSSAPRAQPFPRQ